MFIEPSTNIRLLQNVPLDNTYANTILFDSASEQRDYFISLTKHTLIGYTYQRVEKGVARVGIKAEELYNCNYMMFQNSSFGSKWFYAFITSVEYVNNAVSEIRFELDVMQTWYFDYTLKECFVEREHARTDTVGDNLVPENLELGEYITDEMSSDGKIRDYKIVIAATVEEEGYNVTGGHYGGIYSGLYLNVFDNYTQANAWISGLTNSAKSDGIVSVFMMPSAFITEIGASAKSYTISKPKKLSTINGYTPRNKKLFTYPYNFLYVSNLSGNSCVLPYEYFSTTECEFTIAGDFSCNPTVLLYPMNYKGVVANFDEMLSISGFPQCSWNTDTFRAWLAQSSVSTAVGLTGAVAGGMLGMAAAPLTFAGAFMSAQAGLGIATAVGGTLAQVYEHAIQPRQAHGNQGGSSLVAIGVKGYMFLHKQITKEFAEIIDDYFDMYGYATHKVKVPNRNSRPHWNYVKTIGCNLVASLPADDTRKICNIYDNGITFWKKGANVGNYSLNNAPA